MYPVCMFAYTVQLATPGNLTTNGTANTETETCFIKPGATAAQYLAAVQVGGKGAAVTQLAAVELRCGRWGTASTAGTAMSAVPKDAAAPVTTGTNGSRSTAGTTRTNAGPIITCGATSPNQWIALNPDHMVKVAAGNAGSLFFADTGAAVSMPFSFSLETQEW